MLDLDELIDYTLRLDAEDGIASLSRDALRRRYVAISVEAEAFANSCHEPTTGRFCETTGKEIPTASYEDETEEFERVSALERHYGRKEMAPEMGGILWSFEGASPPITAAAEAVLQGYAFDQQDRYRDYDRASYEAAETILGTIQHETSDVPLFSGHRRPRDMVEAMIEDGELAFPLIATSPQRGLAEHYAGHGTPNTVAVVYEFPPGSQAGFYQANEHLAAGGYAIDQVEWTAENTEVNIKLRQTDRYTVPPKMELEEEE